MEGGRLVKKYYTGMCESCHATFVNLSRWQMIGAWFKHKHLLYALMHSDASFYKQHGYNKDAGTWTENRYDDR